MVPHIIPKQFKQKKFKLTSSGWSHFSVIIWLYLPLKPSIIFIYINTKDPSFSYQNISPPRMSRSSPCMHSKLLLLLLIVFAGLTLINAEKKVLTKL